MDRTCLSCGCSWQLRVPRRGGHIDRIQGTRLERTCLCQEAEGREKESRTHSRQGREELM